jgi:hypothetical protein
MSPKTDEGRIRVYTVVRGVWRTLDRTLSGGTRTPLYIFVPLVNLIRWKVGIRVYNIVERVWSHSNGVRLPDHWGFSVRGSERSPVGEFPYLFVCRFSPKPETECL